VPFPPGKWIRVADASFPAWRVEDLVPDMFPALREKPLPFVQLLTDFDVAEFQAVAMPR